MAKVQGLCGRRVPACSWSYKCTSLRNEKIEFFCYHQACSLQGDQGHVEKKRECALALASHPETGLVNKKSHALVPTPTSVPKSIQNSAFHTFKMSGGVERKLRSWFSYTPSSVTLSKYFQLSEPVSSSIR